MQSWIGSHESVKSRPSFAEWVQEQIKSFSKDTDVAPEHFVITFSNILINE